MSNLTRYWRHMAWLYRESERLHRGWTRQRRVYGVPPENVIEAVAEQAHIAWAGWMSYMFAKCHRRRNGELLIPKWAVDRWERQRGTAYEDLSEDEKKSDRIEARRYLKAADRATPPQDVKRYIDIVFDGPPSHEAGRFVEVENEQGASINFGEWVHRSDGYWALRIPNFDRVDAARVEAERLRDWYKGQNYESQKAVDALIEERDWYYEKLEAAERERDEYAGETEEAEDKADRAESRITDLGAEIKGLKRMVRDREHELFMKEKYRIEREKRNE